MLLPLHKHIFIFIDICIFVLVCGLFTAGLVQIELLQPLGPGLERDDAERQPGPHSHALGWLLLHLGVNLVQLYQLQQVSLQLLCQQRTSNIVVSQYLISRHNSYPEQQLLDASETLELGLCLYFLVLVITVTVQRGVAFSIL